MTLLDRWCQTVSMFGQRDSIVDQLIINKIMIIIIGLLLKKYMNLCPDITAEMCTVYLVHPEH